MLGGVSRHPLICLLPLREKVPEGRMRGMGFRLKLLCGGENTPHPDFLLNAENLSLSRKGRGEEW